MTDIIDFAQMVKQMRDAQAEYFRTRSTIALTRAKKLENSVDAQIKKIELPVNDPQNTLFK